MTDTPQRCTTCGHFATCTLVADAPPFLGNDLATPMPCGGTLWVPRAPLAPVSPQLFAQYAPVKPATQPLPAAGTLDEVIR